MYAFVFKTKWKYSEAFDKFMFCNELCQVAIQLSILTGSVVPAAFSEIILPLLRFLNISFPMVFGVSNHNDVLKAIIRYLGIMIDSKLNFKGHFEYVWEKAVKAGSFLTNDS